MPRGDSLRRYNESRATIVKRLRDMRGLRGEAIRDLFGHSYNKGGVWVLLADVARRIYHIRAVSQKRINEIGGTISNCKPILEAMALKVLWVSMDGRRAAKLVRMDDDLHADGLKTAIRKEGKRGLRTLAHVGVVIEHMPKPSLTGKDNEDIRTLGRAIQGISPVQAEVEGAIERVRKQLEGEAEPKAITDGS